MMLQSELVVPQEDNVELRPQHRELIHGFCEKHAYLFGAVKKDGDHRFGPPGFRIGEQSVDNEGLKALAESDIVSYLKLRDGVLRAGSRVANREDDGPLQREYIEERRRNKLALKLVKKPLMARGDSSDESKQALRKIFDDMVKIGENKNRTEHNKNWLPWVLVQRLMPLIPGADESLLDDLEESIVLEMRAKEVANFVGEHFLGEKHHDKPAINKTYDAFRVQSNRRE